MTPNTLPPQEALRAVPEWLLQRAASTLKGCGQEYAAAELLDCAALASQPQADGVGGDAVERVSFTRKGLYDFACEVLGAHANNYPIQQVVDDTFRLEELIRAGAGRKLCGPPRWLDDSPPPPRASEPRKFDAWWEKPNG